MKRRSAYIFVILGLGLLAYGVWLSDRSFLTDGLGGQFADNETGLARKDLTGFMGGVSTEPSWIPVGAPDPMVDEVTVTETDDGDFILDFKLSGFWQQQVSVLDETCSRISLPGRVNLMEAGYPEVPVLAVNLPLPDAVKPLLKLETHVEREFKLPPVEPSLGHLTRDIDPATVKPFFAPFYRTGGVWPEAAVVLGEPFTLRKQHGVNVRLQPLRYDAGAGVLLVTERLRVRVVMSGAATGDKASGAADQPAPSQDFDQLYGRVFGAQVPGPSAAKYQQLQTRGRMLIITDPAFVTALEPFATWKRQLGIEVLMRTTAETGPSASEIYLAIRQAYLETDGLTWVILVGDKAQIPTNAGTYDASDSDSMYGMLAGGDLYPDVFVSRISATTSTEVQTQVAKFIAYERDPQTGTAASWYRRAAGIASAEGEPTDAERADLLRTDLLTYGFEKVYRIYEGEGGVTTGITAAVGEGCSLINYLGHGTGTSWYSIPFTTRNVNDLTNSRCWPWIVDVSCSNGKFELDECLAEAWLRAGTPTAPCGAVGIISSTSLTPWVPPTVMQAEIIDLLTTEQAMTLGALYYSGLMKVLDLYAGLDVATRVVEQHVVFGDCSLTVRTAAPGQFDVTAPTSVSDAATTYAVTVAGGQGATVALTTDEALYGTGLVGDDGTAELTLTRSLADVDALRLTVSGFNMVPYLATVSVVPDDGSAGDDEGDDDEGVSPSNGRATPEAVTLLGNYPNPFNPTTHIAFELGEPTSVRLVVYDIRGRQIKTLIDGSLPAGRQEILWNGCDHTGRAQASGVYLYVLQTPDETLTGRMTLAR